MVCLRLDFIGSDRVAKSINTEITVVLDSFLEAGL
jgi:hypothetical protein